MIKYPGSKTNLKDYLLLFIVCCVGLWQITLFHNIMKWDIVDINLPFRYFISECITNGVLPLWNPYIYCGFPQAADPMTWYPISWLTGFIFGNNLVTLQYEYLFHLFIGAVGFYNLTNHVNFNRETRLITSISFMLSGLFISNAQHFGWIISAAWFPFILNYFLKFCKTLQVKYGLTFILFLFLQLTGGYPGFFVVTVYVLIAIFIFYLIRYVKQKQAAKYLLNNIYILVIFIPLSLVVIISSTEIIPFLTRANQLNPEYSTVYSLPVKAVMSFILPFSTTINADFWGADTSLINCYFGIIPLIFLIYTLLVNKNLKIRIFFLVGVFFICVAMAEVFPFRKWLYYLPLMNIFRFPTIFRFFGYFIFIVICGIGINTFIKENRNKKLFYTTTYIFLGILSGFLVYNAFHIEKWKFKKLLFFDVKTFLNTASINDRIFLQAFISFLILTVLVIFLKKINEKKRGHLIILFVAIEMILATQLNVYHSVVSFKKPTQTQVSISNLPEKFPLPDLSEKIININDRTTPPIPTLWRNMNIFYKKTSYDGYSPYYFSAMYKAETEGVFHSVIKNPLFFLSDRISSGFIIDSLSIDSLSNKKIKIEAFNPNGLELTVKSGKKQLLTLVQNYYPGWKAYINNSETEIIKSNYTFMSIWVEKGENRIVFQYKPQKIIIAFYISMVLFLGLLLYLVVTKLIETKKGTL